MVKKIIIDLDEELHKQIKEKAKSKGMTIASLVKYLVFSNDEFKKMLKQFKNLYTLYTYQLERTYL
ncbi:hypothetical protein [Mycoplasma sp. HU2014]|uniref:hypothetical protein n=1 Tax=Mycoplasma sp. HU2014 TaxID=1664275 RepID=UPI00067BDF7F|nr:hypothetical protein [Mycoplasma sp. HU2014]KNG79235.1 plasmid copy number control protein [Mycoplasma sp. HU2014]